jgi:hypothetical protein
MTNVAPIGIFLVFYATACNHASRPESALPDVRPGFARALNQRDSLLSLDSFYFVAFDTINEKKALIHERFPLLHILERINAQLDSATNLPASTVAKFSQEDLDRLDYLKDEKNYVGKEIDSLNQRISKADSSAPRGYRALYKVTVRKGSQFVISDTIAYSIDLAGQMSDWDRNLEKNIDSLSLGKHVHDRGAR